MSKKLVCGNPADNLELKRKLTPEEYMVMVEKGTERPFNNRFWDHEEQGIYVDAISGVPLFSSEHKFDAGCGWPSFTQPIEVNEVVEIEDTSHGMIRTEVRSRSSNAHLGHVFNDGPPPTGLRYCINSASLKFISQE